MYQELLKKKNELSKKRDRLELDYRTSRETWVHKESEYRFQIQELMKEQAGDARKPHWRMEQINEMQQCIMSNIGNLQNKTTQVLKAQERDLSSSFKTRINSLLKKLEDKSKPAEETMQWITKCHDLTTELNWIRDMTTRMQAEGQRHEDNARKLKTERDNLEADRSFLIKSLLAVKKENQRLRRGVEEGSRPGSAVSMPFNSPRLGKSMSARSMVSEPTPRPHSALLHSPARSRTLQRPASASAIVGGSKLAENQARKQITKMRRQVQVERKKRQALEMKVNQQTAGRNELQMFLKQCISDVKTEIDGGRGGSWGGKGKARVRMRPHSARGPAFTTSRQTSRASDLGSRERSRVLELLFAQERVLELLYSQAFPNALGAKTVRASAEKLFDGVKSLKLGEGSATRIVQPGLGSRVSSDGSLFHDTSRRPISPAASPMAKYTKR